MAVSGRFGAHDANHIGAMAAYIRRAAFVYYQSAKYVFELAKDGRENVQFILFLLCFAIIAGTNISNT